VTEPEVEFPPSPGHFTEFARAVKGGKPATSDFPGYAGPLTETVLLGNLAAWAGKKVAWDVRNLKAANAPGVKPLIRPEYRKGGTRSERPALRVNRERPGRVEPRPQARAVA
jgi:hypothetical protein